MGIAAPYRLLNGFWRKQSTIGPVPENVSRNKKRGKWGSHDSGIFFGRSISTLSLGLGEWGQSHGREEKPIKQQQGEEEEGNRLQD